MQRISELENEIRLFQERISLASRQYEEAAEAHRQEHGRHQGSELVTAEQSKKSLNYQAECSNIRRELESAIATENNLREHLQSLKHTHKARLDECAERERYREQLLTQASMNMIIFWHR